SDRAGIRPLGAVDGRSQESVSAPPIWEERAADKSIRCAHFGPGTAHQTPTHALRKRPRDPPRIGPGAGTYERSASARIGIQGMLLNYIADNITWIVLLSLEAIIVIPALGYVLWGRRYRRRMILYYFTPNVIAQYFIQFFPGSNNYGSVARDYQA